MPFIYIVNILTIEFSISFLKLPIFFLQFSNIEFFNNIFILTTIRIENRNDGRDPPVGPLTLPKDDYLFY